MKPQRLGNVSIPDEELVKDKKECKKIGPCGIGKKAVYLSSFYIDRRYYIPISSVKRIFKRIAMSKGGFTGKGVFGTLSYLVVVYEDGKEKQCNFKHEEDVDRFLAHIEEEYPDIPVHSLEAERKLAEKERWLAEKQRERNVSEETKAKYYAVNNGSEVKVAEKAKNEGVKEFIFMSSMIVYGESAPYGTEKIVDEYTVPNPANFYGDSKLQADMAVRDLADDLFKVLVLRPPMIYGKGSKGNYPTLAKLAKKLPVFPDVDNARSMLHIDNLCEFLCQIMLVKERSENAVVLFPQK